MAESKKNKHLTPEDRKEIEDCLCKRMSFKAIAKLISKDPTTISYEVKHHRTILLPGKQGRPVRFLQIGKHVRIRTCANFCTGSLGTHPKPRIHTSCELRVFTLSPYLHTTKSTFFFGTNP